MRPEGRRPGTGGGLRSRDVEVGYGYFRMGEGHCGFFTER